MPAGAAKSGLPNGKAHSRDVFAHYRTPAIDPANYPEN